MKNFSKRWGFFVLESSLNQGGGLSNNVQNQHFICQIKRVLTIDDDATAVHYLKNVSYYRLAGYWWPMQEDKANHIFKKGSNFSDVIKLYNFDRELRILLFDVIEKIEISKKLLSDFIKTDWFLVLRTIVLANLIAMFS